MAKRTKPGDLKFDRRGRTVVTIQSQSKGEPPRTVLVGDRLEVIDKRKLKSPPPTQDDDVSIDELKEWVEFFHGVPASFVEAVEVDERLDGKVVWQGAVKVFALTGHPLGATRAYAWSVRTEGTKRKFKAMLGIPPVDGPVTAVRVSILADLEKAKN